MLPFRKITFPVDFSDSCKAAVPHVRETVERYGAQLNLIHAIGWEEIGDGELAFETPQWMAELRFVEEERLRTFAAESFPGVHVELSTELGDPSKVIRRWIDHQQTDLVMLPTNGRGLVRRFLIGSVTAKLLHDVSAAVWTATPDVLAKPIQPCRTILCACDVGNPDEAKVVLTAAANIAQKQSAQLSVLHVVQLTPVGIEIDYAALHRDLASAAADTLRELRAELGITATQHIVDGFVPCVVREHAIQTGAGLIVTGRGHQQDTVGRLWSNLYEIVREAPCPVLSI